MLLIAELGVAVLLLSAGALAFRQSRRERLSNKRMFRVCVVLGLLARPAGLSGLIAGGRDEPIERERRSSTDSG